MTHTDLATSVFLQPVIASIPLVFPSLRDIHLPTTGSPAPTSEVTPDIDRGTIAAVSYHNRNLK